MKEHGMIRAAPLIRAVILIVLLGMLAGWAQAYGYALASATNRPVGAGCWSVPGRPWVTCYRQENGPFGPGGTPVVGRVETWAPTWPAPPRARMPSVAPATGLRTPGWEYPVSSLALYPTAPRPTHMASIGPEGWYVSGPYTGRRRQMGYDPFQRAAIQQHPLAADTSEVWYR